MALLTEQHERIAAQLKETERALIRDVPLPQTYFRRGDDRPPNTRVGLAVWPGNDLVCGFIDAEVQTLPAAQLPAGILATRPADGGLRQIMVPYRDDLVQFLADLEAVLGLRGQPHAPWMQPIQPTLPHRTKTPLLDGLAIDLTEQARQQRLTPPIAREAVIERVCQILRGLYKHNPCLVSEPGVGKTKMIEGVAIRIQQGVPGLEGCRVLLIEPPRITAKAAADGLRVEELVLGIADEASANRERLIVACDELHQLFAVHGAGGLDAGEMLKPYLGRGRFRLIGACTHAEYRQHVQQDPAFERRFIPVPLDEPSIPDAIRIVAGIVPRLEAHHRIRIPDQCVEAAVKLSHRLIQDRFLPDKAIDLIDQAAARLAHATETLAKQPTSGESNDNLSADDNRGEDTHDLDRQIADAIDRRDYRRAKALTDARAARDRRADRNVPANQ